jgi:WD40 repeat protein
MAVLLTPGVIKNLFNPRIAAAHSPGASNLFRSASLFRRNFVKLVFRSQCAIVALLVVFGAFSYARGQVASATPDPFAIQLTSNPGGFYSFAGDFSANGRFVVFESNGDVATEKIPSKNADGSLNPNARNNEDGNREIFVADYAQRRIYQITNTKNVQKPTPTPSPTPTPTATPTPTPGATPTPTPIPVPPDLSLVKIEISNNNPMISFEPALVAGKRIYTIVFSSNAPDPANFDGTDSPGLVADGNQEIWIYRLPEVDDVFDLSNGDDVPPTSLTGGAFRQITNTTPSLPLRPEKFPPDVVDDNRDATISDDGTTLAFISTRDLIPTVGNADFNPELFFCRTTNGFAPGSNTFAQGTKTVDVGTKSSGQRFQQNPSLSFNGNVVAFISTANLAGNNDDSAGGDGHGNAEVYVADFNGSGLTNIRQITKTKAEAAGTANAGLTLNLLSPGRRLSRDGAFVAYESRAEDPTANSATHTAFLAVFVSKTSDSTATLVGPRALACTPKPECGDDVGDVIHFPTFTDYDSSLAPNTLVFASALNFKSDGTFPAADQASTGLNPVPSGSASSNQIFATQVPVTSSKTFARLTKNPGTAFTVGIAPLTSNTRSRIAFNLAAVELGGGNSDSSPELFYLLSPGVTTESAAALSFFTGASNRGPFASASPTASPTPTPTPTPGEPAGLAPGELSVVKSTVALASSDKNAVGGPETARSPILPVELNGVSVSVNGAAAGLYFVGDSPAEGISFVMPVGFSSGVVTVVVNDQRNNNGTTVRGFLQIVPSQPDIFTSTDDAGGIATVCNVTNTATSGSACITGPFKVTTADSSGTQVPTVLEIWLTGTRFALASETKVSFITGTTTTDIIPTSVRPNTNKFGFDLILITLPASLAGTAPIDYKLIVTVTKSAVAFTSRPEATAPQVTIIP